MYIGLITYKSSLKNCLPKLKLNQLTVMCTTRGEKRLISVQFQKECVESKLDGQMDSHADYSAHLRVVQNFDTKS